MIARTMPSFGLPSSISVSSSTSPCVSSVLSSNLSSCSDSSCAPVRDGCMSNVFENSYLHPPPPLSLSEAAPYSPPPAYPPPFSLPSLTRFPPPPNSSFSRPIQDNITFFEGPNHYSSELHTPYDRWPERNNCTYGSDNISKCASHWPLPSFNSNSDNNSSFGFPKSEPGYPSVVAFPPLESFINYSPKVSALTRESSGFTNAAVMSSTSSAPITSPFASGHFSSFPPPNLPLDFPLSSTRFPFNPHAPFIPGMDHSAAFSPCTPEFLSEPFPSYLSRTGPFLPSYAFQAPDHFHDASSRAVHSPETAPRPIRSSSPSCFYGPHPPSFPNYSATSYPLLSLPLSSRNNNNPGPLCSSDTSTLLHHEAPRDFEPSSFAAPSSFPGPSPLPYPPLLSGSVFRALSSAPPLYQDYSRNGSAPVSSQRDRDEERVEPITNNDGSFMYHKKSPEAWPWKHQTTPSREREEECVDRIISDTGKLMYQHMSPEEWRWKHYEPRYTDDALDITGFLARACLPAYNHFNIVDCSAPNSSYNVGVKEEISSLDALSIQQKEQFDMLERSKAQNQSGPSLKFAASALAEMLALGTNGGTNLTSQSMLIQTAPSTDCALTSDASFPPVNGTICGQTMQEGLPQDCSSSNGSYLVHTEDNDVSASYKLKGLLEEGFSSGPALYSPTRSKRGTIHIEDAICDFGGVPSAWVLPKVSGQAPSSTNRTSWMVDVVPQSAKGGALPTNGQRRVFSKASAGIIRQPLLSLGSAKLHGVNVESSISENCNHLHTQSPSLSPKPLPGTISNSPQLVGEPSSEDPTSVVGPFTAKVIPSGLSIFSTHQDALSSGLEDQLLLDPSHSDQWVANSTSRGSSPPLSQAYMDPHDSRTTGSASRIIGNLKWASLDGSSQTETACMRTGFRSLTASISNLSKVLLSFDSTSLTQPDSAALEETLQSSILRLSECLLLEQSRMNKKFAAARSVGSTVIDESSSVSRQGRADGSFTEVDLIHQAQTGGITNLRHVQDPAGESSVTAAQLYKMNDLQTTPSYTGLGTIDTRASILNPNLPAPLNNNEYSVSNLLVTGGDTIAEGTPESTKTAELAYSSQLQGAAIRDVVDFLRNNGILELSSLERLVGAEAREAKLKIMVEELREELEFERVENRGTAILCEKIMQEAEVSGTKAVKQATEKKAVLNDLVPGNSSPKMHVSPGTLLKSQPLSSIGSSHDTKRHPQCANSAGEYLHDSSRALSGELGGMGTSCDQDCRKSGAKIDSATSSDGSHNGYQDLELVESRLALRQGESAATPPNSSQAACSDRDQVESRLAILRARTGEKTHVSNSHVPSMCIDQVESRLALLQARSAGIDANSSTSEEIDQAESQLTLLKSQPSAYQENSLPNVSGDMDQMDFRTALLQARPSWDNELGVFTETEPCTPANAAASESESSRGFFEEQVVFTRNAFEAMSQIKSQLLRQSKALSSMETFWSQLSGQVESEILETESKPEGRHKDPAFAMTTSPQAGDALPILAARPCWTEVESESETEDGLGDGAFKVSSQSSAHSGSVMYENDQFEMLNEISLVRLLDSEVETTEQVLPLEVTGNSPSLQGVSGDTNVIVSLESEKEAVTRDATPNPQDIEEEAGWEHVRLPQKELV